MSCPQHACRNACGSSLQNGQYSRFTMKMETAGYLKRPGTLIRVHWVTSKETNLHKHSCGKLEYHVVLWKKR